MTKQNGPRLILGLLILKQIGVFENIQRKMTKSEIRFGVLCF